MLADALQRLLTIDGGLDDQAAVAKQLQHHLAVDGVVLHQQHPGPVGEEGLRQALRRRERLRRLPLTRREGGGEPETAALAKGAVDASLSSHQGGKPTGDREPEACAAVFAGGGDVGLLEGLEQLLALLLADADAGIFYLEAQQVAAGKRTGHPYPQGDSALLGKLDGIGGVVEQCLAQAGDVAMNPDGRVSHVDHEAEALGTGLLAHQGADVVQHGGEGEVTLLQRHLARIYLGEIQDVIDDGEQVLGGIVDLLQPLVLGAVRGVALEQISQPQDGVHGSADLVAHVGQEGALGTVGALGALMGLGQLQGALVDHLLQVVTVLIQLLAELFLLCDVGLYRHIVGHSPVLLANGGDGCQHLIV